MANVFDIANYILEKHGAVTAMKLQKLVYYAQAWSLVWDEKPLFDEEIQAWANGPVVPALYVTHSGQFKVETIPGGDATRLTEDEKETVDGVLEFYGGMTSQNLSALTHRENPWREARNGLNIGERGNRVITHFSMHEYYSGLSD